MLEYERHKPRLYEIQVQNGPDLPKLRTIKFGGKLEENQPIENTRIQQEQ